MKNSDFMDSIEKICNAKPDNLIKPIERFVIYEGNGDEYGCREEPVRQLEKERNDFVIAVINFIRGVESADRNKDWTQETIDMFYSMINLHLLEPLEKQTGLTYAELNEERK